MHRPLAQILGFLAVMSSLTGLLHYYVWARLVRDTALPAPYRGAATVAIILLGLAIPLSFMLSRVLAQAFRPLSWVVFTWMGTLLLLFLTLVSLDLVRAVYLAGHRIFSDPLTDERRAFLGQLFGGAAALTAASLGGIALRLGLRPPSIRQVEVPLRRLPRAHDGTTIVQLTDLHIGPTIDGAWLAEVVRRTNALEPDIVAITGDLVDGSVADMGAAVGELGKLRAKRGVYFVTGNHEYYSGADAWIAELERLGVRVLRNERVPIHGVHGEPGLDLAGVDDYHAHGMAPGHGPNLPQALSGRDPERALVLLAHQPKQVHEAAKLGVCLQLSGHTHGGQIWPWSYAVLLQQPYVAGLEREGDTFIYVSSGTGYWGPPMRLGAIAEITHITLRSAAA
jgi:predicted MPP superfamily phosphohydrolase